MTTTPVLHRSRDERVLAGVCGGLAEHLGMPVAAVRIGMAILAVFGGAGALFYLWLWVTAPEEGETSGLAPMRSVLTRPARAAGFEHGPPAGAAGGSAPVSGHASGPASAPVSASASASASAPPSASAPGPAFAFAPARTERDARGERAEPGERHEPPVPSEHPGRPGRPGAARRPWPVAELLLGTALLVVGIALVLDRAGARLQLEVILPGMAVLVGVGLTWWQIADRARPERHPLPRVLGALALVAVGVLMFFVTAKQPDLWTVVAAALSVLAGIGLALAPWLLRINRELMAERAAREREAERSEIAAHLHDSVLQTLALIQQRAAPGSEVDRLARGQERELREWLFRSADGAADGAVVPRRALDAELRAHAAELEAAHAVRFELVVVGSGGASGNGGAGGDGGGRDQSVPEALAAAAREAMLNAARHAGGTVTVYIEIARDRASVDVTDRGPGFDAEELPEGRMGVRESIRGRMERAGGSSRIGPGPGGAGTTVRLSVPLAEEPQRSGATGDAGPGAPAAAPDASNERNEARG